MHNSRDLPLLQARDPIVQDWRARYYDPERLNHPASTLDVVIDCLGSLVDDSPVGRNYETDDVAIWHTYRRAFLEVPSIEDGESVVTEIKITNRVYPPPRIVREDWQAVLRYDEPGGRSLYGRAYRVTSFVGGVASMEVGESLDGVAFALTQDDERFTQAVRWKEGTEHDATILFDELFRIKSIQAQTNVADQSVITLDKWYD